MLLSATLAADVLFFYITLTRFNGVNGPCVAVVVVFFFFLFFSFLLNPFLKPQQKKRSKNCSIRVDGNHRSAVLVKAYFHSVHYLLSVWSTHDSPLPFFHSHCLTASLLLVPAGAKCSNYPVVLWSFHKFQPPRNSPQTYEYMVFLSAGSDEVALSWCFSLWNSNRSKEHCF